MPSENSEIVERAHQALNSGDIDALVGLCDDEFRLAMSDRVFNPAVYEGHDGIRQFYAEVRDVWEVQTALAGAEQHGVPASGDQLSDA